MSRKTEELIDEEQNILRNDRGSIDQNFTLILINEWDNESERETKFCVLSTNGLKHHYGKFVVGVYDKYCR